MAVHPGAVSCRCGLFCRDRQRSNLEVVERLGLIRHLGAGQDLEVQLEVDHGRAELIEDAQIAFGLGGAVFKLGLGVCLT